MPQANSFDSILEQCRDLVCERVADALSKMLDEADGALTTFEVGARDPETQKLYQVTRNKVLAQRDTIVTQFRMRFLRGAGGASVTRARPPAASTPASAFQA